MELLHSSDREYGSDSRYEREYYLVTEEEREEVKRSVAHDSRVVVIPDASVNVQPQTVNFDGWCSCGGKRLTGKGMLVRTDYGYKVQSKYYMTEGEITANEVVEEKGWWT